METVLGTEVETVLGTEVEVVLGIVVEIDLGTFAKDADLNSMCIPAW